VPVIQISGTKVLQNGGLVGDEARQDASKEKPIVRGRNASVPPAAAPQFWGGSAREGISKADATGPADAPKLPAFPSKQLQQQSRKECVHKSGKMYANFRNEYTICTHHTFITRVSKHEGSSK
jgi:hypothetical protein